MYTPLTALVLLVQCLVLSSKLSSLHQLYHNGTQSSSSTSLILTSTTSPVLPPGFQNDVKFDFETPLRPRGFFLAVAWTMGELCRRPWDSYVPKVGIADNSGVVVVVRPTAPSRLRVSHAALGLNALAVTAVTVPIFYRCKNKVSLLGTALGDLEILPRDDLPGNYQVTRGSESNFTTNNSGESGTIVHPATPEFKIGYNLYRSKIDSRDIFTAVLDGLMTIAQYDRAHRCEALQAIGTLSATGQAVITIHEVSGSRELDYDFVAKALLLIFEYLNVYQNKFNEMEFEIFWVGEKIGAGDFFKLGPLSSAGPITA